MWSFPKTMIAERHGKGGSSSPANIKLSNIQKSSDLKTLSQKHTKLPKYTKTK